MTLASRKSLKYIPDSIQFYPHQIEGIRDLARRTSFLLADEMGLGKSLQSLTVAAIDFERGWATRIIVIAPASLKWNWEDEAQVHTNFKCHVLDGTPKQRERQLAEFSAGGKEILIVNYEQVIAHLDTLNKMKFDIAIYDEAHYLKSHKSKRSKACRELKTSRRFLLTGSPLLNQVNELWGLLNMIDPFEFPNYWRFVNRYAVFGGFKDKQIVGVKNAEELTERLQSVMLRRLKKDVLDLPDKQYLTIRVDLHPEQTKLYKQISDNMQLELPGDPTPMEIENALTKFLRLKQVCGTTGCFPGMDDFSIKLDVAVEKIIEIIESGEPTVVFTQFREVQRCLVERLAAIKVNPPPVGILNGDTPKPDRVSLVKSTLNQKRGVLVAMLQVAGVGLNMTQANKCIFVDKLFVPKLNEQAEDRLHRIGADKTKPIQIIELIARNTIEQRIEAILRRKRKLFDTLVENGSDDWKKALYKAAIEEEDTAA